MDSYTSSLSRLELYYLSDALSMHAIGPPNAEVTGRPYPALLLRILTAINALTPSDAFLDVTLTEADWWSVREIAKTPVRIGSEQVGLNLLNKAAKALVEMANRDAVQCITTVATEEKFDKPGVLEKLQKRIDRNEARRRRNRQQTEELK